MNVLFVNVDLPTRRFTIHQGGCTYVLKRSETPYKGLEERKRDGGWFGFEAFAEALAKHTEEYSELDVIECSRCTPISQKGSGENA